MRTTSLRWFLPALAVVLSACTSLNRSAKSAGEVLVAAPQWESMESAAHWVRGETRVQTLKRVEALTRFAEKDLGLKRNRSFTVVSASPRELDGWRLVAVPELGFGPMRDCGLWSGCTDERLYASRTAVLADAEALRAAGNDVDVLPVVLAHRPGGRTPLPQWILGWRAHDIDYLVLHELALQALGPLDDEGLRASFAHVVAREAQRRWLGVAHPGERAAFEPLEAERDALLRELIALRRELAQVLASNISQAGKRAEKQQLLERARAAVQAASPAARGGRMNLERWLSVPLNGAHLYALHDGAGLTEALERSLAAEGADLRRFVARVRELARLPAQERRAALEAGRVAAR